MLGGMVLWQLGVEFERAWLRSYDGPLLGEPGDGVGPPLRVRRGQGAGGGERRWVAAQRRRHVATAAPVIRAHRG